MEKNNTPPRVDAPPLIVDKSASVPNFEPILFLMGFGLLILFLIAGAK